MLEKLFNKKNDEETKSNNLKKEMYFYLLFFAFVIVVVLFGGKRAEENPVKQPDNQEKFVSVEALFDNLKDNYSINLQSITNDKISELNYDKSPSLEIYESKLYNCDSYMFFENRIYTLKNGELALGKDDETNKFFNKTFYNLNIIKSLIKYSKVRSDDGSLVVYDLKVSDYLKEYNYASNTTYKIDTDKLMDFEIQYSEKNINSIKIDYTEINKLMNKSEDNLKYIITISNVGTNDFEEIIQYLSK